MKEEINKVEIQHFKRNSAIFSLLLVLLVISAVPLAVFLGYYGLLITAANSAVSMYYAIKSEKPKKKYDIQTYKEIVVFTEGKELDEIEKARESGKRPYQKVLLPIACGAIAFVVCIILAWLLSSFR